MRWSWKAEIRGVLEKNMIGATAVLSRRDFTVIFDVAMKSLEAAFRNAHTMGAGGILYHGWQRGGIAIMRICARGLDQRAL